MNRKTRPFSPTLLLAVVLLLVFFGQAVIGSVRLSLTTDEPMHISMGYTVLTRGDYRLLPVHIHPPLVNAWAAWPLLLLPHHPDPYQVPGWEEGNLFKFSAQLISQLGPVESVELATRVPIMLLALVLGALVYRWASDLAGARAGLVALFLYVLDPGIVSNSQFNTTDIGALAFGVLATFAIWRATRRSTPRLTVLAGLALGASIASKVSGLFFAPMLVLLVGVTLLCAHWGRWGALGKQALRWGAHFVLIYVLALSVVWAVYRFEVKPLPGIGFPVPAASHWLVLQAFNQHVTEGHLAFLAGQVSQHGWWWYFPLAFVIKTPIPTLLLLLTAVTRRMRQSRAPWTDDVWLLVIPVMYFANAMFSTIDIGYRHLLPVLPFVFIFMGVQISHSRFQISNFKSAFLSPRRLVTLSPYLLVLALFTWYIIGAVRIFPHYQAYFNELVGGADGGWRYLADSNTDWGQSLKELAEYQQANGIERVRLSMFTFIDPAWYGVRYEPLTPMRGNTPAVFPSRFNPPPGAYVISATTLDGIPLADPEMFDWFRQREPDAKIGHVMFVYRVKPPPAPGAWVAQCAAPVAPLEPAQIAEGFGQNNLRRAYFDCAQSWLYPTGGTQPGWFVLARDAAVGNSHWVRTARLSYEQRRAGFSPPFRIYEDQASSARGPFPQGGSVIVAPSALPLNEAIQSPQVSLPVTFENGLTLLGYTLDRPWLKPGETVNLETVWRIDGVPSHPLSLMAHILTPDGRAIAVGDGLGVPLESWQTGDVFVQRHKLTLPQDAQRGSYWIQTGVYGLDDGRRWHVQDERATGDRLLLTSFEAR